MNFLIFLLISILIVLAIFFLVKYFSNLSKLRIKSKPFKDEPISEMLYAPQNMFSKQDIILNEKDFDSSNKIYYLIIDLQTTGLYTQKNKNSPPVLVEMALLAVSEDYKPVKIVHEVIRQNTLGSKEARQVHKLSFLDNSKGKSLNEVENTVLNLLRKSSTIVGHHLDFDLFILRNSLSHNPDILYELNNKNLICTMLWGKLFNQNVNKNSKYPTLEELTKLLNGEWTENEQLVGGEVAYRNVCYTLFCLRQLQGKK